MKSFRIRIIFWTSVIAGAVMLGFGIAGNLAFKHIKERQVDDTLRAMVGRATPPPSHNRYWNRFGPIMQAELENRFGADVVVAVYGREGAAERDGLNAPAPEFRIESWGELESLYANESDLPAAIGLFDPSDERGRGPPVGPGGFDGRDRGGRVDLHLPSIKRFSMVSAEKGDHWRIALAENQGFNVLVGVNFEKVREDTALMRKAFLIAFPVALLAMAACIWIFVTKAISPVRKLSHTIASVSAKSLGARVDSSGEYSEFAALIDHFNGMLERLERSFTQATRFSADAAHELKTPLAILQGQLEVALQRAGDGSSEQELLGGLLEETHRLKSITRKLLILAKADAGTLEIQRERVDLKRLVAETLELAREDDPGVDLQFTTLGENFDSLCDDTLCRQILNNLVGNALKYRMPRQSPVAVRLVSSAELIALEVSNRCESLGPEVRSRLFDRFIRGDAARNRSVDGTGLGLSLSLEFAKAQGGRLLIVEGTQVDELCVRLELPIFRSEELAPD